MCGIFGIATVAGRSVELSDAGVCRLRDMLAHRGPDAAGLWRSGGERPGQFVLAHRRLAVIDPSPAGAQPMLLDDPSLSERFALVYNGELYNDEELRRDLHAKGVRFRSLCDTETLLHVLAKWGPEGIARLHGMFAFALVDRVKQTLLLGRDPMGIKPLYYWVGEGEVVFASEAQAILAHPALSPRPDQTTISAYMTTIRTTMGERTLFEGVRCVLPGEVIEFELASERVRVNRLRNEPSPQPSPSGREGKGTFAREVIEDSVRRHLRSDVATCSLLSGGLDSSIIVAIARRHARGDVRTYCSGHDDGSDATDLAFARLAASHFGTVHTAAPVTREMFAARWPEMVQRMGTPLSTPNEVAINEVARRLRADGQVVALSGEGADELFGGYELPMRLASEFVASGNGNETPGGFQLRSNAWMTPEIKASVLHPDVWRGVEQDAALTAWYDGEFAACARQCDGGGVQAHLTFHRRVNLVGLLARLDTATMLEGVEGRTPFADIRVCEWAEALPMTDKYRREGEVSRTKIILRESFAPDLPPPIVSRQKASFPLPFQQWVIDSASILKRSDFSRSLFRDDAIDQVCANPGALWNLAWPMINLAMWGERWWPSAG